MSQLYSHDELFDQAAERYGITLHRQGANMVGGCPECREGTDRFVVWEEGNFWCRVCGITGWLFDNKVNWKPDPERARQHQARVEQLEIERRERVAAFQKGLQSGYVLGYHNSLTDEHRAYLHKRGVTDDSILNYTLGFCPKRTVEHDGKQYEVPAYTIPIRSPKGWEIVNIQFRLTETPWSAEGAGKYRQVKDLPASAFYSERDMARGQAIVLEGGFKAIVVSQFIEHTMQVVGLPGVGGSKTIFPEINSMNYERIYFIGDPGAEKQAAISAAKLTAKKVGIVTLPMKPDDAILYGMSRKEFRQRLLQAYWL